MITNLTDTTGTVQGIEEVKTFIALAYIDFNEVRLIKMDCSMPNYIQYTLLTFNRIAIYY